MSEEKAKGVPLDLSGFEVHEAVLRGIEDAERAFDGAVEFARGDMAILFLRLFQLREVIAPGVMRHALPPDCEEITPEVRQEMLRSLRSMEYCMEWEMEYRRRCSVEMDVAYGALSERELEMVTGVIVRFVEETRQAAQESREKVGAFLLLNPKLLSFDGLESLVNLGPPAEA